MLFRAGIPWQAMLVAAMLAIASPVLAGPPAPSGWLEVTDLGPPTAPLPETPSWWGEPAPVAFQPDPVPYSLQDAAPDAPRPGPSQVTPPLPPLTPRLQVPPERQPLLSEPQPPAPQSRADEPLIRPFADVAAGAALSAIAFGDTYAPNMMGDSLGSTRSVSYFLTRTGPLPGGSPFSPPGEIDASGAVYFRNAKIAENNSPIPRNRAAFRYNHFHNAIDITGYTLENPVVVNQLPGTVPAFWDGGPYIGLIPMPVELVGGPFPPVVQLQTVSRSYDLDLFTFSVESMLVDELLSLELRLPFSATLASDLDLPTGIATGSVSSWSPGFGVFDVTPTPELTLGREETEWGDATVILKGLLSRSKSFALSGGLALGMPTGKDTSLVVTDYLGLLFDFTPAEVGSAVPGPRWVDVGLENMRTRTIEIENETWYLSPFLAAAAAPTRRAFWQGFLQVEVPLGQNHVTYDRSYKFADPFTFSEFLFGFTDVLDDVHAEFELQEQTLLHCDVGGGYWFYLNPGARKLRGIAGLIELHYTTTLNNADTVLIPGEPAALRTVESIRQQAEVYQTESGVIGNTANRLDILNLTAGATFLVGNRTTVATGLVLPLRDGHDKLFDWEFNLQLNYYFGRM